MRFPSFVDLDREQRAVYGQAPSDGAILVVGPPGTGKTIMAFHRAEKVKALGQAPHVIMFNNVLQYYTSQRDGVAKDVPSTTMHSWASNWWRRARMGSRLPIVGTNRYDIDWFAILAQVCSLDASDYRLARLNWDHLIIDEGQDFPEQMYYALGRMISHLSKFDLHARVTVFADDNQRLQIEKNSSVSNIARHLGIRRKENRLFYLSKNYRNTAEVAKFSRYFQVGFSRGVTSLPRRRGGKPSIDFFDNDRVLADFIVRKSKLSPGKQIGVIVNGRSGRVSRIYNQIKSRIQDRSFLLQWYLSGKGDAQPLNFTLGNTITVLHQNSAKGLEFDVVFYIGLEQIYLETTDGTNERMAIYVMSSRSRSELNLCFADIALDEPTPPGLSIFPDPKHELCGYEYHGSSDSDFDYYLSKVEWLGPEISNASSDELD